MFIEAGVDFDAMAGALWRDMVRSDFNAEPVMTDFTWVKEAVKREARLAAYAEARRQLDKFVGDCVQPLVKDRHYAAAAKRLGLDWESKSSLSHTDAFAIVNFAAMHDDSIDDVAVDRGMLKTGKGKDADYDAAIEMLQHMRFAWCKVLGMKAHCGLRCLDLLTGRELFLFDRQLSAYPQMKGAAIVADILPVDGCYMTTGFGLPVFAPRAEEFFERWIKALGVNRPKPIFFSKKEAADFVAKTVSILLKGGMGKMMQMR